MKKKKVAVIGLGDYGTRMHIPALIASQKAELVGVSSSDPKDVKQYSEQFHTKGFENPEELMDTLHPDFIILTVYHNQYLPLVEMAAKRGIHILKEKPLGHTMLEAEKIVAPVEKYHIHMMLGVNRRFAPVFQKFHEYILSMKDIYAFQIDYAISANEPNTGWRAKKEISGGGATIDFGYHAIDVLLWNLGLPRGILAEYSTKAKPKEVYDTDDTAAMLIQYKPQALYGTINLSRVLPRREYYKFVGSSDIVEYENGTIRMKKSDGTLIKEEALAIPKLEVTTKEIDYFCDVIDGLKENIATPQMHREHMAFITAAYDSEVKGKYIDPSDYITKK